MIREDRIDFFTRIRMEERRKNEKFYSRTKEKCKRRMKGESKYFTGGANEEEDERVDGGENEKVFFTGTKDEVTNKKGERKAREIMEYGRWSERKGRENVRKYAGNGEEGEGRRDNRD